MYPWGVKNLSPNWATWHCGPGRWACITPEFGKQWVLLLGESKGCETPKLCSGRAYTQTQSQCRCHSLKCSWVIWKRDSLTNLAPVFGVWGPVVTFSKDESTGILFFFFFWWGGGEGCFALAWKIPWMERPGELQSMGSLRVGHD